MKQLNHIKKNIKSFKKNENSKKYISINDNSIFNDLNLNNAKKKSVNRIKGIKIHNFNKILSINREISESNSSKKCNLLNYKNNKILIKIPTNKNYMANETKENKNKNKINNMIKLRKRINNRNNNKFDKSLTEREKSNNKSEKYKKNNLK